MRGLAPGRQEIEARALELVTAHGLRAMDAWHLACADLVVPGLARGDQAGFASRDDEQAELAAALGFARL